MASLPSFRHIHCSSRFDRSAASLDADLDVWRQHCSLFTCTEVTNDQRAAQLRTKGWAYYNSKLSHDADNCAIAWDTDVWRRKLGKTIRLSANTFDRAFGMQNLYIWAATVVLVHRSSGHKLLVSVSHPPAHIEGPGGWRTDLTGWQGRKRAYLTGLSNWATHVSSMELQNKTDGTLVVADWNLSLKEQWVRDLLKQKFGKAMIIAWRNMPTDGGSLHGGPSAPAGAPGHSSHDRIIDGTLYRDLKITDGPNLMSRVASSDHRPYNETFSFKTAGDKPDTDNNGVGTGDTYHGTEWWGFGDYMTDEVYALERATGETGGEVL